MLKKLLSYFHFDYNLTPIIACDKTDCKFYSEWGINKKNFTILKQPEKWRTDDLEPRHYTFTDCTICKHFKGFDLYCQDNDPNILLKNINNKPK